MSRKNLPFEKKIRALERAIKKGRVPTTIDLAQWLEDRKYASTKGKALSMIYDGHVMSESHVIRTRYVPASIRATLRVKDGVGVSDES